MSVWTGMAHPASAHGKMLGCRDFVVVADPIDPSRVNVYEEWESEDALMVFRGDGPDDALVPSIVKADITKHVVSSSERA